MADGHRRGQLALVGKYILTSWVEGWGGKYRNFLRVAKEGRLE